MSRVLPILFNGDMVRAILDGRKTVTRRLVKPQPTNEIQYPLGYCTDGDKSEIGKFAFGSHEGGGKMIFCKPPYQQEDVLYVRETWYRGLNRIMYKANYSENEKFYENGKEIQMKWHPSIHMPKEAARIWLKVKDVRVERLQEITWQQAAKEGCQGSTSDEPDPLFHLPTLRGEFQKLWNSTIKKSDIDTYGWDANPWVWVIEFERCEKPDSV